MQNLGGQTKSIMVFSEVAYDKGVTSRYLSDTSAKAPFTQPIFAAIYAAIFVVLNRLCKLAAISWRFVTLKRKKTPVKRLKI